MKYKPTILIIVGITGDLSKRKLLPAIEAIAKKGEIPEQFKIVGVTRQSNIKLEDLLINTSNKEYLRDNIELFQMDLNDIKEYERLGNHLKQIEKEFDSSLQYLFYLSVPPVNSKSIIGLIGESGLAKRDGTKLLLEKPFGTDLESAKDLVSYIDKYFKMEQVYRIDHYMAKETAQNIIIFRDGNSLFKRTWNKDFIERIEIIASEEIGIEGRANFYEQTGALRDYVQSHLLQLASLALMNLPEDGKLEDVPLLRLEALKNLKVLNAKRGQYKGYIDEVNNSKSYVETFASINIESSDLNWKGVEINLITGKALREKSTEIKILYKKDKDHESNELLLKLQPDEGISFSVWVKTPGYEHEVSRHALNFSFKDSYSILPEAYEQVLWNAMNGDHSLFSTSEEVLETWRILDSLQKTWRDKGDNLIIYEKGSTISEIIN